MIARLRNAVLRSLRMPPPPDPPAGSVEATRVFRAAPGLFYRRLVEWALAQGSAILTLTLGWGFSFSLRDLTPDWLEELGGDYMIYVRLIELASIGLFVLQLVLSLVIVRLDYELRWYIVTDRSLRIREGIFSVREQTVGFANIQNVSVQQGPIQRLLGIADVEIRTAGGGDASSDSGQGDHLHRAVFRGVDNANEIRDLIRTDLRRLRKEAAEPAVPNAADQPKSMATAATELADAATALRSRLALP